MPKIKLEYRHLRELQEGLKAVKEAAQTSLELSDEILKKGTQFINLRYTQQSEFKRILKFLTNNSDALKSDLLGHKESYQAVGDDVDVWSDLEDSQRTIVFDLDRLFKDDALYTGTRKLIEARIRESGPSIISPLESAVSTLECSLLSEVPDGHLLREFLTKVCELKIATSVVVKPEPAVAEVETTGFAKALKRDIKHVRAVEIQKRRNKDSVRVRRWPRTWQYDLDDSEWKWEWMPASEAAKYRERRDHRFEMLLSNSQPSKMQLNKRLNKVAPVTLVEDLQYLSSETVSACYRCGIITVPELITHNLEQPRRLTDVIKRLGDSRLLELQFALAELGVIRVERDIMVYGKDANHYDPRTVTSLTASPIHKLFWVALRYLEILPDKANDYPLNKAILPSYDCHISRNQVEYEPPDVWVTALPHVTEESFANVFGSFGTNDLNELEALDSFERYSYNTLKAATTIDFDSEDPDEIQRQINFGEIIAGYTAFKMIYGQDREGMTWYDHKYGHQPWIAPTGYDSDFEITQQIVDEDDFAFADKARGVRGVPLSVYGKIEREHPVWWTKD